MLAEELLVVFPNPFRAVAALFRAVRAYFKGDFAFVSGRLLAKRKKLCNTCFYRDPGSNQCRKCTCWLELKQQMSTEKCPIDRW